jgi:hypothetical protein
MNPFFNRSAIQDPALFIGREDLIRKIFSKIAAGKPQSVSLFGERRIGKSSVLSFINTPEAKKQFLPHPEKYLFAYIDFQQFVQANPDTFFGTLLKNLHQNQGNNEEIVIQSNGYDKFKEYVIQCQSRNLCIILLFDEFEKITKNTAFDLDFYSFLRFIGCNYQVAFITSSFAVLQELCHSKVIAASPFFNIFSSFHVLPFTPIEAEQLITSYLDYCKAPFSFKDYYSDIFGETGFFPFFIQIYCSILYEKVSVDASFTRESLAEEFLEESNSHFSFIWSTFSSQEKRIIIKIVLGEQITERDDYPVKKLLAKGYIIKRQEKFTLFSRSLQTFLLNEKEYIDKADKPVEQKQRQGRKLLVAGMAAAIFLLAVAVFIFRENIFSPELMVSVGKVHNVGSSKFGNSKIDPSRGTVSIYDSGRGNYVQIGTFHALLIGIQNYSDPNYQQLREPIHDAEEMAKVLKDYYTFDAKNIKTLHNPTKKEIFKVLTDYGKSLTADDNLLVFYAGHGRYDSVIDQGYLIPSDADFNYDDDWISYYDIRKKLELIDAKHILLIADACFAGTLSRGNDSIPVEGRNRLISSQISKKSRNAISSAGMNSVPDKSIFLRHLISSLRTWQEPYLMGIDLFINTRSTLKPAVSSDDPIKWLTIKDCGDLGGDFVFIRRSDGSGKPIK